tara:strand:+ start:2461 stop:2562 length:102 start_codon:yes stop_codon:yes gene_type:complete
MPDQQKLNAAIDAAEATALGGDRLGIKHEGPKQ